MPRKYRKRPASSFIKPKESFSGLGKCMCGKTKFHQKGEADYFLVKHPNLKRVYFCGLSQSWHVTKKTHNFDTVLESNLNTMVVQTVQMRVIAYMRKLYEENGVYKVSLRMLRAGLPGTTISPAVSAMKKTGVITNLGERIPDQRGAPAFYFALTEVLEKVTDPDVKTLIPAQPVKEETVTSTPTKPTPTVANPFEKVQGQLDLIAAQIKGLSQGYSDILNTLKSNTSVVTNKVNLSEESKNIVVNTISLRLQSYLKNAVGDIPVHIQEADRKAIVNEVSSRLSEPINNILNSMEKVGTSPIPANATSEYKEAFKEGIKFALEMGLSVR